MRTALLTVFAFAVELIAAPPEPVPLEHGVSPNKRYDVVLEADKDTPAFQRYEFKGDDSEFPAFLVRELPSHRIVARLTWPGDASAGDEQPLRSHTRVLWSPAGDAVIVNTNERFYSYSSVLTVQPETGRFVQVPFPDYKTLTGFEPPDSSQLRARGFTRAEWTPEGLLVYAISSSPQPSYDGPDPLRHRITLRVTPTRMEVVGREVVPEDA